jgi:hypothetical protein
MINAPRALARAWSLGNSSVCHTLHKASVLLVGAVQRALRREAQPLHHLAQRRQAQRHVELAFNTLADDAKRPQAELESKLIGVLIPHCIGDPLQLLSSDFGRSAGAFLGKQGILAAFGKRRDSFKNNPHGHRELLSHGARRNARPYHFCALHSSTFPSIRNGKKFSDNIFIKFTRIVNWLN